MVCTCLPAVDAELAAISVVAADQVAATQQTAAHKGCAAQQMSKHTLCRGRPASLKPLHPTDEIPSMGHNPSTGRSYQGLPDTSTAPLGAQCWAVGLPACLCHWPKACLTDLHLAPVFCCQRRCIEGTDALHHQGQVLGRPALHQQPKCLICLGRRQREGHIAAICLYSSTRCRRPAAGARLCRQRLPLCFRPLL